MARLWLANFYIFCPWHCGIVLWDRLRVCHRYHAMSTTTSLRCMTYLRYDNPNYFFHWCGEIFCRCYHVARFCPSLRSAKTCITSSQHATAARIATFMFVAAPNIHTYLCTTPLYIMQEEHARRLLAGKTMHAYMASCIDRQLHSLLICSWRRRAYVLTDVGFKDKPVRCRQTRAGTTTYVPLILPASYGNIRYTCKFYKLRRREYIILRTLNRRACFFVLHAHLKDMHIKRIFLRTWYGRMMHACM
jgi:hypothetical protein